MFAFTGSTTRGPVSRHATTTVFGRQRIGALSSEMFVGPFGSGNIQAIAGHHFGEDEVYPCRTSATAAGSVRQLVNENNIFVLPFSCSGDNSTAHTGVLSTDNTLTKLHNQLPYNRTNNVTRCHIQNELSWHALFSVMNCPRRTVSILEQTVPRLSALAQADYTVPLPPQPGFPFPEQ